MGKASDPQRQTHAWDNWVKSFHFFPVLAAGLALLLWFSPLLFRGQALFWGTPALQFVPWWTFAFQTLLDGHLPLWNPGVGMGAPLLANYQTALFYPPTWTLLIFYVLGGSPWLAWGLTPLLGFHLLFSALGMAWLLRRLDQGIFAQSISALVWAMSSYLTARVNFPPILFCAAWLPWILLILTPEPGKNFLNKGKFLRLVFCLSMLLLSGHAQTTWYVLLLAAAWSAFWIMHAGKSPKKEQFQDEQGLRKVGSRFTRGKQLVKTWAWFGAALMLAAGMASVQLWPTAEYLLQSQRAQAVDFDLAMSYSLWPWKLASLLAPGLFGSPVQGDYWGYANYWEDALYIGLLPFLLALSSLLKPARMSKDEQAKRAAPGSLATVFSQMPFKAWVMIGMALTLIWALGRYTPVFPWFYRNIPTFDLFQAPARVLIWFEFLLALMAGLGAGAWRKPQKRGLYWTRLGTAGAGAVSLGAGIAWLVLGEVSPSMLRATALAGFWGVLAGLLSLTAPITSEMDRGDPGKNQRKFSSWQLVVLAVVMVDLLLAAWGLNPGVESGFYQVENPSSLVSSLSSSSRAYLPPALEESLKFERFLQFDTFSAEEPWHRMRVYRLPNLALLEGKPLVNNFDPFVPGRYAKWMEYLDGIRIDELREILAWMNVDQFLSADAHDPSTFTWQTLDGSNQLHWVSCTLTVADELSAWQTVTGHDFDWGQWVVLEDAESAGQSVCTSPVEIATPQLRWVNTGNPNQKRVEISSDSEGWLVFAHTWYPGWQARLDGERSVLWRANYLFQAVHIPPGEHHLELVYQPLSFRLGMFSSLVCLVIVGWMVMWGRRNNG